MITDDRPEDLVEARPRLLTAGQVRELLLWPDLIASCRKALSALAEAGGAPPGTSSQILLPGAALHLKAGALLEPPVLSVKANLRPDHGRPSGAILAFDHHAQRLDAIIASGDITAMRTGAVAAVAADALLADKQPRVVALIGAGAVARMSLRALREVLNPGNIRIWSRDPTQARRLANDEGATPASGSSARAIRGAALVITCTPAREPVVFPGDLDDETVVLAMGADSPGKRELGAGVLRHARIYVDAWPNEFKVGECAYLDPQVTVISPLGERLAGPAPGSAAMPGPQPQLVVFDSIGSSAVDAAAVALVLQQARIRGIGSLLELDSV